ncbi:MAG: hypothetical protein U0807_03485 [Candidatus Binatia bacterium]
MTARRIRRAALGTGVPIPAPSLWRAVAVGVLERAADDLRGRTGLGLTLRGRAAARHDAARWFASEARGPFSFGTICDGLDLDREAVRKALGLG